jgi:RNA chaperone Hfq
MAKKRRIRPSTLGVEQSLLQREWYDELQSSGRIVTVYMMNGRHFTGQVVYYDSFSIMLQHHTGKRMMVQKLAMATVVPVAAKK